MCSDHATPRVAALAALAALAAGCGAPRPNILLITLDTTRADRLGCYGHERATSPKIDALAAESTLYSRAYSTSSWTLPAHASLFTGKLPASHGARYDAEGPLVLRDVIEGPERWNVYRARGLAAEELTLASILAEQGYATGAVVGGPWLKRPFGLAAGFRDYDDSGIDKLNGRLAEDITDRAVEWLAANGEGPFFLFLNYFDPHPPYRAPGSWRDHFLPGGSTPEDYARSAEVRSAHYDAEILYMDYHVGRLLDDLRRSGLYDRTWIIVTADHGELLGEHDEEGHGVQLWEEEIHVPLVIKPARARPQGQRVDVPIQLTDILPRVLHELRLPVPPDVQGRADEAHPIVAEYHPVPFRDADGPYASLLELPFKLVRDRSGARLLFDLASDPAESNNLLSADAQRAEAMRQRLEAYLATLPAPPDPDAPQELDAETREQLESLGYVQ
jgi:arylsulfatase A-like enzyme